jgi:hypothetical protein
LIADAGETAASRFILASTSPLRERGEYQGPLDDASGQETSL